MNILIGVVASYLIGSVSPSYILGKIIKKIDVREFGDGNAGALNAASALGLAPAIIVALFDAAKGIFALILSSQLLNIKGNLLLLPIAAAIAGHIFPFYLHFRGGQGSATAAGLLLFSVIPLFSSGRLPLDGLAILVILILLTAYVARKGEYIGLIALPMLAFFFSAHSGRDFASLAVLVLTAFLCGTTLYNFFKKRIYVRDAAVEPAGWRAWARLAASSIIVFLVLFGKTTMLLITGIGALLLLGLDLFRAREKDKGGVFPRLLHNLFQRNFVNRFSSLSFFFLAVFTLILLFPTDIALLSLSFLIGGVLLIRVLGSRYSRMELIGGITLEHCLSCFAGSLAAGFIVSTVFDLSSLMMIIGALASAFAVLLSANLDESFSIGIVSATAMYGLRYLSIT